MALVHQQLYQSDSLALVNMPAYIREITERLLKSFDCLGTVRERLDLAPVELGVTLATPLGLILNEAITNALKHAFPQRWPGTLGSRLQPAGPLRYERRIADDGVGLPADVDLAHGQTPWPDDDERPEQATWGRAAPGPGRGRRATGAAI